MTDKRQTNITYVGPKGTGFGWQLAGIKTADCDRADEVVAKLKKIKDEGSSGIVLVDEGLAENVLEQIETLNEGALPAIVLVTRPGETKRLAARKMDRLLIKAVGSDILSNK